MGIGYVSLGLAGVAFATPRVFNALYPSTVEKASLDEKIHDFFNKIREKIHSPTLQTIIGSGEENGLSLGSIEGKVKKLFTLGIPLRKKIDQLASSSSSGNFYMVSLSDNLWLSILMLSFLWQKTFLISNLLEIFPLIALITLYVISFQILICCSCFSILRLFLSHFLPSKLNQLIAPSSDLWETTGRMPRVVDDTENFFVFCERYRRELKVNSPEERIPEELHGDEFFKAHECLITGEPIRHPLRDPTTNYPLRDPNTGRPLHDPTGYPLFQQNTGTIYEARAIIQWVEEHGISPISRRALRVEDLEPVLELQAEINEMLELHQGDS